jgi:glucuronate isomerase
MKPFLGPDFLLDTATAQRLYHEHAATQPIIDYHCHLPPAEIANDRRFANLTQIWLEGDHYKWRGMRAAGIEERFITGDAGEREKYDAWARTVPKTLGNPLYVWTHLELQRPFGITGTLFGPDTADRIWKNTAEQLATEKFSAQGIIKQMKVRMIGTTDDPVDDLRHHAALAAGKFTVKVLPSFRPDRSYKIELPGFADYMQQLGAASNVDIRTITDVYLALEKRLDHFQRHGCSIADHGIEIVRYAADPGEAALTQILQKALRGAALTEIEIAQYFTALQLWLGRQYSQRDWVMQYHMGAQRNNNGKMAARLGANTGFDSIGDRPFAEPLAQLLSAIEVDSSLPRTILYGINPASNEVLATMAGNFQDGSMAGKIQYGAAWWFNDQQDGMYRQLMQLSQHGLLGCFVGMLTDSRSFLSYTRHEYFRRILCAMLGRWVEQGEIPNEPQLVSGLVQDICFRNANRYFRLGL